MPLTVLREKSLAARSRLTIRALRKALALGRQRHDTWLSVVGWMMPKAGADKPPLHISRRVLRRIASDTPRHRVKDALDWLSRRYPLSLWPSTMAAQYAVVQNDPAFGIEYLARHFANGALLSARCVAQLATLQMEAGRTTEAQRTLSTFAPDALSGDNNAYLSELELLAASAYVGDEAQWLRHVNRFLAQAGLDHLALRPGATDTKFTRLSAGARNGGDVRAQDTAKVTVIISCFNAEQYLETSFHSVMDQTYANLEIIAVDDCSSDGTWDRLTALAADEPRMRLLRNPKNVGTYVSRNRALRACTGDYVTTQDSDDWSHPARIEHQVSLLEAHPSAVANYCAGVRMWADGRFETHKLGELIRDVCYPSLMYRKSAVMERAGYWDCVRAGADSEYLGRIEHLYGRGAVLECAKPLMIQLRREGSLTTQAEMKIVGATVHQNRRLYAEHAKKFLRSARTTQTRYEFETWVRPFPAPEVMSVPEELVREAATWSDSPTS